MKMFCDNKTMINLINNIILHGRKKHVEVDQHFIKEKINSKELVLPYMKIQNQVVDMFSKGCP